jgi:hypothetical protein
MTEENAAFLGTKLVINRRRGFPRLLPIILAMVAAVGWFVAGYSMWQSSAASSAAGQEIHQLEAAVAEARSTLEKATRENAEATGKLQAALDRAGHDREVIAKQLTVAQAIATEARLAADKANAERDDALNQVRARRQRTSRHSP